MRSSGFPGTKSSFRLSDMRYMAVCFLSIFLLYHICLCNSRGEKFFAPTILSTIQITPYTKISTPLTSQTDCFSLFLRYFFLFVLLTDQLLHKFTTIFALNQPHLSRHTSLPFSFFQTACHRMSQLSSASPPGSRIRAIIPATT